MTSILNRIPYFGPSLYKFVVGGFSVTNTTLVRVFSAHVCLAFVILGLAVVHLFYLHLRGSNNPLFVSGGYSDVVLFHRYYTSKDGFVLVLLLLICCGFLMCSPDFVLDVERYIEADPLVTPVSIKPEWYFLAFYAMLRSVESKIGGLVLVLIFLFVLWLPTVKVSASYRVSRQILFWLIVVLFILLSYLGACHPEFPYVHIRKAARFIMVLSVSLYKGLWATPYSRGDFICSLRA